jgi:hypothetical protein
MLRLAHVRVIAAAVAFATPWTAIQAQQPSHRSDCNLAEKRFDNPFADHSGWSMRRYEWHAFYAAASTATAEGIHRITHMPRWASAVTATVALGIVPHLRSGVFVRRYPVNPPDWGFDLFNRAAPLFVWSAVRGGTTRSDVLSATTYVAGYVALACYASP